MTTRQGDHPLGCHGMAFKSIHKACFPNTSCYVTRPSSDISLNERYWKRKDGLCMANSGHFLASSHHRMQKPVLILHLMGLQSRWCKLVVLWSTRFAFFSFLAAKFQIEIDLWVSLAWNLGLLGLFGIFHMFTWHAGNIFCLLFSSSQYGSTCIWLESHDIVSSCVSQNMKARTLACLATLSFKTLGSWSNLGS